MENNHKYFIITVDTEGDGLWGQQNPQEVSTNNAKYIMRFQNLCEKYGFKPVYLTNYEMAKDNTFISLAIERLKRNTCEIGIHIHAWNNPPYHEIEGPYSNNSYLIEYPPKIMREKFAVTYNLIRENFGVNPVTHRAGRWAMNDAYFKILSEFNIKVDCSYTPGIDWSHNTGVTIGGSNYSHVAKTPHLIGDVLELPVTINTIHHFRGSSFKNRLKNVLKGEIAWIRPATTSLQSMIQLLNKCEQSHKADYIEFMIHSSELMPGGSPYFKDDVAIERLYKIMEDLFQRVSKRGYSGILIKDYYEQVQN